MHARASCAVYYVHKLMNISTGKVFLIIESGLGVLGGSQKNLRQTVLLQLSRSTLLLLQISNSAACVGTLHSKLVNFWSKPTANPCYSHPMANNLVSKLCQ